MKPEVSPVTRVLARYRVKRFVNTCQLLLAMRPPLRRGSVPSERRVLSLAAAVNEGLPAVAEELFSRAQGGQHGTLGSLVDDDTSEAARCVAFKSWVDGHPEWRGVPLGGFAVRLDMVKRLRFEPPAHLR